MIECSYFLTSFEPETRTTMIPTRLLPLALASLLIAIPQPGFAETADPIAAADAADRQDGVEAPGIAETAEIAEAGFIYGLPIVMNYTVMYQFAVEQDSGQFKAPFNELENEHKTFTYKDTAVVTPNSDTPYSMLWLDLRAEPMVITVPAVPKDRYYSVQLCDGNTYNYGYIGSRATGSEAGKYLVTGPGWTGDKPAGIDQVFTSSTEFSIAIFRTQLFDPADMPNVEKVQAGYGVQPLSGFLGKPAPPAAPEIDFPKVDDELAKKNFFEHLDFALQFAPAAENEKEIRAKLARIGVGPGKTFEFAELSDAHKVEVGLAMKEGDRKITEAVANVGTAINGWRVGSMPGDAAHYDGDWLRRAVAAKAGIYGNDATEATYPITRNDADGDTLDGSKHDYTLTFAKGQLPPVNSFWSVTMYDAKTQLLIENPIDRYLINSPMLPGMKTNDDGSVTLFIQKDSPGADKEANWLPAPDGPIYLVMRLYWPKTEAPSILPAGSGSWNPPGIVQAK